MTNEVRILLLEDSKSDVELLRLNLRSSALKLKLKDVQSEADFTTSLREWQPDLIISDYSLPAYDGRSALTLAKVLCPDTPFIFYSGTIGEEAAIESLKLGANDYVLKDKPRRLISAIQRALDDAEQKRRQRQSDEKIKAQANLLDLATDAIVVRDMDDRIVFWNSGAEKIYGLPRSEALGRKITALFGASAVSTFPDAKETTLREGQWQGEMEHVTQTGRRIEVMSRWSLVRNEHGHPHQILSINSDITDKKELERQFLRAQRLESVGTLASGIAHDLNNVLAPIMMASDALEGEQTKKDALEMVSLIKTSADRGSKIVKQLLTFVRGGDGTRSLIDVGFLAKEVAGVAQKTFPKNIATSFEIERGLQTVCADPTQLHQVLMNLCINARDAMPAGGKLRITAKSTPEGTVVVEVSDTGTGMPSDVLEKIFDPFFTTKEPGKGTGLGLSTTMGIVKSHGGKLTVESQLGVGTVFRMFLPVETQERRTTLSTHGRGEVVVVANEKIEARKMIGQVLSEHGFEVRTAHDSSAALGTLARYSGVAKILIADARMHTDSGQSLTKVAREIVPGIGVIAISTSFSAGAVEADAVIQEPLAANDLLRTVAEVRQIGENA
jgi:two-component system cell cycle sensor histidine kinase/response regulator CckA